MKSAEEIFNMYEDRRKNLGAAHAAMLELRSVIGGEMAIPLPEINQSEKPAVANLIAQTVDQKAMRIASTMPTVKYPELRSSIKRSENLARQRRQINLGWWSEERMQLKMRERARHAVAYDASAVMIRPDFATGRPTWKVRDPATCLPPPTDASTLVPDNVIYAYKMPLAQIRQLWPACSGMVNKRDCKPDTQFTVLEYVDADECVFVVCGDGDAYSGIGYHAGGAVVEAQRLPNLAGRPLAVVAGRVSLAKSIPRLFHAIGMYQAQAQLFALELIGMQRSVWPETWFNNQDGQGKIVQIADPLRGVIGEVQNGSIAQFAPTPSPFGMSLTNQLERNIRVQTATPAEFGGESTTSVRTGRRGDAILSATIDFELQEVQQLFEASLQEENKIAIAIDKAFFKGRKTVSFVSSSLGQITYDPDEVWETDDNVVAYSMAGVDQQELVIGGLQRVGAGVMSKESFMSIDPLVEDAESERDRIVTERLNDALLSAVQTRAAQDPSFVGPLAELMRTVKQDRAELAEAYLKVDQKFKEQQAAAAAQQAPPGPPGPEQMPGLAKPQPAIGAAQPSQQNLASMLMTLRNGQQAGMAAVGGA